MNTNNDFDRAEFLSILKAISEHNFFVIIEDYSIIKRRIVFSIYSASGQRYYASRTDFCYPVTDDDIYEHICNALTEKCNINIKLSNVVVFVPAHAASLCKAFLYNGVDCMTYHCNSNETVGMSKTLDCILETLDYILGGVIYESNN